jgi:signal transduction histidine kinase
VETHGGTISLKSKPGKGATFIVELPIVDQAKQGDEIGEEP